jgi:hypothetical protein
MIGNVRRLSRLATERRALSYSIVLFWLKLFDDNISDSVQSKIGA